MWTRKGENQNIIPVITGYALTPEPHLTTYWHDTIAWVAKGLVLYSYLNNRILPVFFKQVQNHRITNGSQSLP